MTDLNRITILGRVGRDPETRHTQAGAKIVSLSVATSERWKDRQSGDTKERTGWHRVVLYADHAAAYAEQYLRKGSRVLVEGSLGYRDWEKDGVKHTVAEIVVRPFGGQVIGLDAKPAGDTDRATSPARTGEQSYAARRRAEGGGRAATPDLDDDIPF